MKSVVSLNGSWQLAGIEEGQANWSLPDSLLPTGAVRAEGHVPGEVHVDLYRAGLIPDPYFGVSAHEAQWVEGKEWWYKRTFDVEDDFLQKRTFLEFDGLYTSATIYLNGRELGSAENMLIPYRFDVTDSIREGRNTIAVKFAPAAKLLERAESCGLSGCSDAAVLGARRMRGCFGWDHPHRLVGAGVWRDVNLVSCGELSITDVHVEPEIVGSFADAWITIEVENHTREDQQVMASVVVALGENREKIELAEAISPFGGVIEAVIRIEEPELWWPNGMGEPALYTCMVGLESEGAIQDIAERKFGVRSVAIVERDHEGGSAFTLLVNGEEVFCKGGNWIPADHFVSNVTDDRYRDLVTLARDGNFNMLRVWGGGVYERPAFYSACDETGIMLWHDFMFSCGAYPDSDEFARRAADEVETVVKELRNHPSIVLWCGNNECEMNFAPDQDWSGRRLFHEVIPNVLKRFDHARPYRPSSPYGGSTGNDPGEGDWYGGSWFRVHGGDHTRWRHIIEEERGLFVSEFSAQGPPLVESLKEFIAEDKLFPPTNEVWEFHNTNNLRSPRTEGLSHQQILVDMTRRMMGDFGTLEQFAAYAGTLQGEFLKAEIEHYRREKWAISGALLWMFNDCWPAVGWSVVDYFLRPKAAYYHIKRAFAPVILSFKQLEGRVQLYVTSDDRLRAIDGTVQVGVFTFDSCSLEAQEVPVRIEPNTSRAIWESEPTEAILTDPSRQCLVAMLTSRREFVTKAVHFARTFGEMDFPRPKLLVEREQVEETRHRMLIAANGYARGVEIGNLPAAARPSDSFFDLLPGEQHEVIIDGLTVDQANEVRINVWRR